MVEYPIPKIPSNLAATNAIPGSETASAKVWSLISTPPKETVSVDRNPERLPEPYLISNLDPSA